MTQMMATGRQIASRLVVAPMQQTIDPKMIPVGQIGQQQQMDQQMQQQLDEVGWGLYIPN